MEKERFLEMKKSLTNKLMIKINGSYSRENQLDYELLKKVLDEYCYESKEYNKGTLSRVICDSIIVENSLIDELMQFDRLI